MMSENENGGGVAPGSGATGGSMEGAVVRVVLFDADEAAGGKMRGLLEDIAGVRLLDSLSDGAELLATIEKSSVDLVVASLDPAPDAIMPAVSAASKAHDNVKFLAVSSKDDASLIKAAMRSGFGDVVKLPEEVDRLEEEIAGLRKLTEGDGGLGRIVTVLGSAGGVGCTTVAVNLAVELAEKSGREVALVDLNFQFGHVAMMLDLDIQHSIADLCGEGKTIDERVVQKAVIAHKTGVCVIPRPREFEETEGLNAAGTVQLLTVLRKMYPYVVLDGPNRSDPTALAVLDIAAWNLLVVQPLVTAARNAKRILGALAKYEFKGQPLQVICNRAGGGLSHLNTQRLEKSLGSPILMCIPDDWTSVSAAINLGEPLAMNAPKSKARDAICDLAEQIRGPGGDGVKKDSGLLSRLFK